MRKRDFVALLMTSFLLIIIKLLGITHHSWWSLFMPVWLMALILELVFLIENSFGKGGF